MKICSIKIIQSYQKLENHRYGFIKMNAAVFKNQVEIENDF